MKNTPPERVAFKQIGGSEGAQFSLAKPNRCVVVESPCAANNSDAWRRNRLYCEAAIMHQVTKGNAPYASHWVYAFTDLLDDDDFAARAVGMNTQKMYISRANMLCVYTDFDITPGMLQGIEWAEQFGVPIVYYQAADEMALRRYLQESSVA